MTLEGLKSELRGILALEEHAAVDWQTVEARCLSAIGRLSTEAEPDYPHDVVYHFLDDPHIRRNDPSYGDRQRHGLKDWLAKVA